MKQGDAGMSRRIVCAAVRASNGDVLVGIRHYSEDMHRQIHWRIDGNRFKYRLGDDQGFVDTWGEYLTRREAYVVAQASGQIIRPDACRNGELYSEGLFY